MGRRRGRSQPGSCGGSPSSIAAGLDSRATHVALSGGPRAESLEREVRTIGGSWDSEEASAFADALRALERLPR